MMNAVPVSREERLAHLRAIAQVMDSAIAIPGTDLRFGIDPILGLFPGMGDVLGMLTSAYIVVQATRWKLPAATLGRMVMNLGLDWLAGNVPIVGDLFDVTWKANTQNLKLLEAHLHEPQATKAADRWFVFLVFLALGLLVALAGLTGGLLLLVVTQIWRMITGG